MEIWQSTIDGVAYAFRTLDLSPEGLARLGSFLAGVFPRAPHLTPSYLEWAYQSCPDGPALGCNAWAGDELAAHYAVLPFPAVFRGREERGLLIVNLATDPAHRGRGLLPTLTRLSNRLALEAGYGFTCGAANQYSTTPLVNKLGFRFVRALDARFGLAPLPRAVRSPSTEIDFARLWTSEALAWRLRRPHAAYSVWRGRNSDVVFAPAGRLGALLELADLEPGTAPAELPPRSRWSPLRLWVGCDPDRRWAPSLSFDLPLRLRPSPLNWLFLDLHGGGRAPEPKRMRLSALDFDAF